MLREWVFTRAGVATVVAAALLTVPASTRAATPRAPAAPAPARAAFASPDTALGAGWRTSSDVLVTGAGDSRGFHVYAAPEKEAFAWSTVATLTAGLTEQGPWTGNVCVTGSGRYAVAVYAPAIAANKPALAAGGALAAVVDLRTGTARRLADRVQLSYFNPACGPGDRVLLTRGIGADETQTDLIGLDAVTGRVTGTTRVGAQLTTPAPAPDGDYGIVRGALVRVGPGGRLTTVARPGGQPFAVRATAGGALDLLTVRETAGAAGRAVAYRYTGGRQVRLGDAPPTGLALFGRSGGGNVLVGDVSGIRTSGFGDLSAVSTGAATQRVTAVSRQAHLVALATPGRLSPDALSRAAAGDAPNAAPLRVTVRATATGQVTSGTVDTATRAPADATAAANTAVAALPNWPPSKGLSPCAVPRNDIHRQVLQPSANQIEWAVDLAVQGRLTIQRPANFGKTGLAAYTPQGMFPLPAGPRVPAQIMLAILAQETNLAHASWHAVPGDIGNPLVSDYYGLRASGTGAIELIDYGAVDCGYGVAQVTTGMRRDSTVFTAAQKAVIATDYAANIAAGLRILIQKYNEVRATDTWVNNDDPRYLENWFLAIWGYNSGVYPKSTSGPYGVGWFNNPANPRYPPRDGFLRQSLDDARTPNNWSYPERIMGWAETPQWQWSGATRATKYAEPNFGAQSNRRLGLPDKYQFCGPVNGCSGANAANPCPAANSSCWWHGYTSWIDVDASREFATEFLTYAAGSPEPELVRRYPKECTPYPVSNALVVDDLTDSSNNLLCPGLPWGGKFTLRTADPTGTTFSDYTEVDVHQMPGYLGHAWFTHAYDPDAVISPGRTADNYHRVVGTWTPNILTNGGWFHVFTHLPSHGAWITKANYVIKSNDARASQYECEIDQEANTEDGDQWVYLGSYELWPGAKVQLNNMIDGTDGTVDVGYDAMAFVPAPTGDTTRCGAPE